MRIISIETVNEEDIEFPHPANRFRPQDAATDPDGNQCVQSADAVRLCKRSRSAGTIRIIWCAQVDAHARGGMADACGQVAAHELERDRILD